MGAIDLAKRYTTTKKHIDVGMGVAEYPTIQDYFDEVIMDTNASRSFVFSMAKLMDYLTANRAQTIHRDLAINSRLAHLNWYWQVKFYENYCSKSQICRFTASVEKSGG